MPTSSTSTLASCVASSLHSSRTCAGCRAGGAARQLSEGETSSPERLGDERRAAADLADFVAQLRRIDPAGAPPAGRRPLLQLDAATRGAIEAAREAVGNDAATAAWASSLEAPPWNGVPTWIHCDLIPPNLLVERGGLKAIIDFGAAGIG